MNIREAKEEIVRTVRAYTAKDEAGCRRIPAENQRPLLLMGPPGIGKTAVVEQAAAQCGVGLLAYTITHHTRQSAVGLPQLVQRQFDGRGCTVTEYTMSEIVGAVYEYQERTGLKEGILFIDEINCVSETLAPTMLQFLQYKTFGTHRVPEGWIIVSAGNPPECNRSARELDLAALDRVRTLEVEADFSVWKDYALARDIHPAVLSYLELHPEHFYKVTLTHEKRQFVTARGWEDLSVLLKEYERQGLSVEPAFVGEFLRVPQIAADFDSYYRLCRSCLNSYRIPELAAGKLSEAETDCLMQRLREASGDMRCMFLRHLIAAAGTRMTEYGDFCRYCRRKEEVFEQLASYIKGQDKGGPEAFVKERARVLAVKRENGLLKPWEERAERRTNRELRRLLLGGQREDFLRELSREGTEVSGLSRERGGLKKKQEELRNRLNELTDFLLRTFGEDVELADWLHAIESHGDARRIGFARPDLSALTEQREQEELLKKQIERMEGLYS